MTDLETAPQTAEPTVKAPLCTTRHSVDPDSVDRLQPQLLGVEKSQRMAKFFSSLSDSNPLRIVSALAVQELCVCEIAAAAEMSESAVSHPLRTLRSDRLVGYCK